MKLLMYSQTSHTLLAMWLLIQLGLILCLSFSKAVSLPVVYDGEELSIMVSYVYDINIYIYIGSKLHLFYVGGNLIQRRGLWINASPRKRSLVKFHLYWGNFEFGINFRLQETVTMGPVSCFGWKPPLLISSHLSSEKANTLWTGCLAAIGATSYTNTMAKYIGVTITV